jgi:hypothetical protein
MMAVLLAIMTYDVHDMLDGVRHPAQAASAAMAGG